jgi:alcohol dehydrogenase class IV
MSVDISFSFATTSHIIFGTGTVDSLGRETAALGGKHVLLVTGMRALRHSGQLSRVESNLQEAGMSVTTFSEVPPEPNLATVEKGISLLHAKQCDVVVAVGGGSALDVGKAIAALAKAPGTVQEYFAGRELEKKGYPFVAVPTTAGTGAEVTPNSVLIDETQGLKASIRSRYMLPDIAIVDPELLLTAPPSVTANAGMDALCQAIEAFVSKGANPLTDALAKDAAVRLLKHLPTAYRCGGDIEARKQTALGSLMGGIAFANARLGLVHGMAHPLGVVTGLPHGAICALLLPFVIRFNASVVGEKYSLLAKEAGLQDASALASEIEKLNQEMHISDNLPKLRVPKDTWPKIITQTLASGSAKSNPRSVTEKDVEEILELLYRL